MSRHKVNLCSKVAGARVADLGSCDHWSLDATAVSNINHTEVSAFRFMFLLELSPQAFILPQTSGTEAEVQVLHES
jgi:hypothetical protein